MDFGLSFHRDEPAATVVDRARAAEDQGFDEFWVIEDCFFTAGVSLAAAALTATESIGVGIGIMPVVARKPAITAMEIATLAELAPGRFHAGLGHGVQSWMAQMGAKVDSPLAALEETIDAVQRLLAGEAVSKDGRYVSLDDVRLVPPPGEKPLVSAGVRGPKSLAVAGRVADGTILADFVSADYVRWARQQIGTGDHRLTVFSALTVVPADAVAGAREGLEYYLAEVAESAPLSLRMAPFYDELAAAAADSGWLDAIKAMPQDWWSMIAPVGTPDDAAAYVQSLADAGVDCVAFFPNPFAPIEAGEYAAANFLPLLR